MDANRSSPGIIDFMINSGRITDMAAIPVPDFAAMENNENQRENQFSIFPFAKFLPTFTARHTHFSFL